MKIELKPDFPVTEESCKSATGRGLKQWIAEIDANPDLREKRREALNWMYAETKDAWWPTTVWVEYEASKGRVQKDGRAEGYNICVTKTVSAPVETVYKAWTGKDIGEWFGDSARVDSNGSFSDAIGNCATATRVRENKDLRFKWRTAGTSVETAVDVAFTDKGGKTGLLLNHNRIQNRDEADGLRRAWGQAFDRLKSYLEGSK